MDLAAFVSRCELDGGESDGAPIGGSPEIGELVGCMDDTELATVTRFHPIRPAWWEIGALQVVEKAAVSLD